ncbi:DUF3545 family protein [Oceanimonas sp. NS1]|uniref:DUF3545 domain-containing protein n=1 Tax=Oceanimonas doudoroffii TaxID=84158 RepID=A0A233REU0_9GAMM|nr:MULTISPECIES: DUF3545 family protein [Oceanimonas]MCT7655697.1 DUF3545 family protein [Oceanimonas sp. NS1]NHI01419.1 hypothetical protein [Oceanimonas sp. MB9]OXY81902.1 DUF3545 domain-containing protein [Oceanimonas doudoroffii]
MERSRFDQDFVVERSPRTAREPAKKRKWREIEALKDKRRLQEELQQLDCTFELDAMAEELKL